jgi:meso-butanediol dehydrogenase/(S,S)-butanediol dehydrogenase/diacetyl reductase
MQRFQNKVVMITGASSGIGRACALRMASEGGTVMCLDVAEAAVKETVTLIEQQQGKADSQICDVSNSNAVKQAIAKCVSQFGKLDVVINVAGVIRLNHATQIDDETWQKIINVNLSGTFYMCREALPHLINSKGNIVNISSTSAIRGLPYGIAYGASKGGVSALTKSIAVEYAKQGVRANTVCPGSILTDMQKNSGLPEDIDWKLLPRIASINGQFGTPDHIAGVVALIASQQDGAHINGAEFVVDGGTTT